MCTFCFRVKRVLNIAYRCPSTKAQLLVCVEVDDDAVPDDVRHPCLLCGAVHVIDPHTHSVVRSEQSEDEEEDE